MEITNDIKYIGVNDHNIDLFEGQYVVKDGISYNSYVIMDDKICVVDTVDKNFKDEWLNNLDKALEGKNPDYLLIQHMEPDHSANILNFMEKYPNTVIVSSAIAFNMMKNFFNTAFEDKRLVVKENDTLSLGKHTLQFIGAPMVHWPEVIMTYDSYDKVLFTADGFGKFGALDRGSNLLGSNPDWKQEARRYYVGIVGKFGKQVDAVLNKALSLDISKILPLHGPVLENNLGYYIDLYKHWANYIPEEKGIVIAYTSVYGNTKMAIEFLCDQLKGQNVKVFDLARCDMSKAVSYAFGYDRLVLATTTYNSDIFPYMKEFINHLTERNFQNRKVALIENGTWAPLANKTMLKMLENSSNIEYIEPKVTIKSALSEENKKELEQLAINLIGGGRC